MNTNTTTSEAAVKTALNELADAYTQRDIKRVLASLAPDTDVLMYGTGIDEKRIGLTEIQAQAQRDWSQTDASELSFGWTAITVRGAIAWAAADCAFNVSVSGQAMTMPGRFTGVLEQRSDKWLIVQAHFSVPAAGQDEGESFPS